MNISDTHVTEVKELGYAVVPGFVDAEILAEAQRALWQMFPRAEEYFADRGRFAALGRSQFAGLRLFPFASWALNRLAVLPELVDAAERVCGTADLHLYKAELWAKYAGAIDYDQPHHRDYGNHSLVVPQRASRHVQMTTFILLSDVGEGDGPTRIVPQPSAPDVPLVPRELAMDELREREVSITGPAGTLLIYRTDILHRGSNFTAPDSALFAMLIDFQPRGLPWTGKMAWPNQSLAPAWSEAMVRMTPRERALFGFPSAGDPYWDEQTLRDVALRYPGMDMTPYRADRA